MVSRHAVALALSRNVCNVIVQQSAKKTFQIHVDTSAVNCESLKSLNNFHLKVEAFIHGACTDSKFQSEGSLFSLVSFQVPNENEVQTRP